MKDLLPWPSPAKVPPRPGRAVMTDAFRFDAPRLLCLEGGPDLPGPAAWGMAFTTSAPAWPNSTLGLSRLHRCRFTAATGQQDQRGSVGWRLESQPLGITLSDTARMVEGEAGSLQSAHEAAIAAALRWHHQAAPLAKVSLGPAFVAVPVLPGHPRIWGCAAALAPAGSAHGPHISGRLCFIRERIGPQPQFLCTLEQESGGTWSFLEHWACDSLPDAAESGCSALLGTVALRRENSGP